ncbi:retrotransposon nucleocapsid protein, partial [Puccinia sorghi]
SSMQHSTWVVEPPNGLNHIWTSSKTNCPPILSTIAIDLNKKLFTLFGDPNEVRNADSEHSSQELIGTMLPLLSISKKGFQIASQTSWLLLVLLTSIQNLLKIIQKPSELARTLIETNASDYAVAGIISQYSSSNLLHPVAFESRKLHNSELNYEIHDKELLAILFCLQKWCSYLLKFHFTITYRPGKLAVVPDALSRQDNFYPREGRPSPIITLIIYPHCKDIQSNITLYLKDYSISKNYLLIYKEKIVVPDNPSLNLSILESRHDSPLADFSWPGMTRNVKDYFGLLQPLTIPPLPWHSLSMDLISQLPLSNGENMILVVVDFFLKMSLFIRTKTTCASLELTDFFVKHVFSKHGLPDNIVSNHGSLFLSSFWTSLFQHLKIQRNLSTAYHP